MKELLEAAAQNQITAAANSTAATMTGRGPPPAAGGTVVSPTRASLSVLDPQAMQEWMVGNVVTPSQQDAVAPQPTTTGRQGRTVQQVSFALPDDPSRATLLEKIKDQAHAQH